MGELAERVLTGDLRAASKLMREVEDGSGRAIRELQALSLQPARARVIGITGPPGAGKSTLVNRLIALLRQQGATVGVLAVDPSSPITGGAILGDRVRMQEHAADPGVFIRSLATRGHLGGLTRATADCIRIMDALGKEVILVETVGVGQDEVEVAGLADSTVVVLSPGGGDDIQAIKAGILEVADILVVNKADRDGADRTVRELKSNLDLRHAVHGHAEPDSWESPIIKIQALTGEGVAELWQELERHRVHQDRNGKRVDRQTARAHTATPDQREILESLEVKLHSRIRDDALALTALTHKSYVNEQRHKTGMDNERLEFLGDAVVDLGVGHRLMERFPSADEGELSKMRALIVNEEGLAEVARSLKLGELLFLGRGEELTGGRDKGSVLADALEAVIGAVYLSDGLLPALELIDRHFASAIEKVKEGRHRDDAKTRLQELAQERFRISPRYRTLSEEGPGHERIFEVEVQVGTQISARARGRSKKEAEQSAARQALLALAALDSPGNA